MYDGFFALLSLCTVAAITPGPNNFMVLSSSIQHGIKKTLPIYFGIILGFSFMAVSISASTLFFGPELFEKITFIKYFGVAFLVYLSYKIFLSGKTDKSISAQKSQSGFWQMFLFQWMNPKAWAMILSTVTLVGIEFWYLPSLLFFLALFPCVGVWMFLGKIIGEKVLGTKYELYLNKILAALLLGSVYFMI